MGERIKRADVANFIRSFKGGNFDQLTRRDGTGFFQKLQKAFVYNNTGAGLEVGSPVYISGAMNELAYDELVNEYLTSGFCLTGETYDADYPDRPVAFALEPIEAGSVGECRIDGLTPAILTGYEDGLRYAKVNEDTELLAQGDASDYQIIGVSDENESGKRFAFVKPKSEKSWNCWIANPYSEPIYPGVVEVGNFYGRAFNSVEECHLDYMSRGLVIAAIDYRIDTNYSPNYDGGYAFVLETIPGKTGSGGFLDGMSFGKGIAPDLVAGDYIYYNDSASGSNDFARLDVDGFRCGYSAFSGNFKRLDYCEQSNIESQRFNRSFWTYELDLDRNSTVTDTYPGHKVSSSTPTTSFEEKYGIPLNGPNGYLSQWPRPFAYDSSINYSDNIDRIMDYDTDTPPYKQTMSSQSQTYGFGVFTRWYPPAVMIGRFYATSAPSICDVYVKNPKTQGSYGRSTSIKCLFPSTSLGTGHWCLVSPLNARRKSDFKIVDGVITAVFEDDPTGIIMYSSDDWRGAWQHSWD